MNQQYKNDVIQELNRLIKEKEKEIQECNKVMQKIENANERIHTFFSNDELYSGWYEQKEICVKKLNAYKELLILANQ